MRAPTTTSLTRWSTRSFMRGNLLSSRSSCSTSMILTGIPKPSAQLLPDLEKRDKKLDFGGNYAGKWHASKDYLDGDGDDS